VHPELRRELWVALLFAFFGAVLGAIFKSAQAGFVVALCLFILHELNKLRRLHRWLRAGRPAPIPELGGLWDEVIREVHRQDRDSERHKDRISGLFDRLQAAASAMPDAMVVLSQRDVIEWANLSALRLLGLDVQRDIGSRLVHLVRDPALTAYLEGGDYREPFILKDSVAPHVISVQIIPFGSSQKLIIAQDITHFSKLQDMRRHFVADVSHELRTPLTVLQGFLETFQDLFAERDDDIRANLVLMQDQVLRMRRLVDDLLALSRLETTPAKAHDERVAMGPLMANLRDVAIALSGDRAHRIEIEVGDDGLIGNQDELRGAFTNLVHNAIRHTPPGGTIRMVWRRVRDCGHFVVEDTGEGISARHIPFLTERFYRVDSGRSRASGGTGLGLSIVSQVLLRHDAQLTVESTLGKGSTFTCIFPSSRLTTQAVPSLPVSAPVS